MSMLPSNKERRLECLFLLPNMWSKWYESQIQVDMLWLAVTNLSCWCKFVPIQKPPVTWHIVWTVVAVISGLSQHCRKHCGWRQRQHWPVCRPVTVVGIWHPGCHVCCRCSHKNERGAHWPACTRPTSCCRNQKNLKFTLEREWTIQTAPCIFKPLHCEINILLGGLRANPTRGIRHNLVNERITLNYLGAFSWATKSWAL